MIRTILTIALVAAPTCAFFLPNQNGEKRDNLFDDIFKPMTEMMENMHKNVIPNMFKNLPDPFGILKAVFGNKQGSAFGRQNQSGFKARSTAIGKYGRINGNKANHHHGTYENNREKLHGSHGLNKGNHGNQVSNGNTDQKPKGKPMLPLDAFLREPRGREILNDILILLLSQRFPTTSGPRKPINWNKHDVHGYALKTFGKTRLEKLLQKLHDDRKEQEEMVKIPKWRLMELLKQSREKETKVPTTVVKEEEDSNGRRVEKTATGNAALDAVDEVLDEIDNIGLMKNQKPSQSKSTTTVYKEYIE